jgi:hypothetical protein
MTQTRIARLRQTCEILVSEDTVLIEGLRVEDPVLADFLDEIPDERRPAELAKVLAVGVRGITTMGAGTTVRDVGEEVERVLGAATAHAEMQVKDIIEAGKATLAGTLDPEVRSSVTARAVAEIEAVHSNLLGLLDPARAGSHTGRLVDELTELLGPEGLLGERLRETFDPGADDSAMSRLVSTLDDRFRDIRDLIVAGHGRAAEAHRGTAKGVEYEDEVAAVLRSCGAEIGGCIVEETGQVTGGLDARAKVGDAVLTLPDGTRIAVEVKNTSRITLSGKEGILDELDRAMVNRGASWGICVSKQDAYPGEVGAFAVYGNRILLVDDGDGVLVRVALRWIQGAALAASSSGPADLEAVRGTLDRIKALARRFTSAKRSLAGVCASIDGVRNDLDGLRLDLLDLVDELYLEVRPRPLLAAGAAASHPGDGSPA